MVTLITSFIFRAREEQTSQEKGSEQQWQVSNPFRQTDNGTKET